MDHLADAEEQLVAEIMRQKLNEITAATEAQLSGVKDHVNFTLQQAYFKCAYECFDRSKTQEEIGNCVEYCTVPVLKAHYLVEDETAKFAENMKRSLTHCQDKFVAAKLQQDGNTIKVLESCVDLSTQHCLKTLPYLVRQLKTSLDITE
ncbi:protein FAM136A-like [Ipomoea triloba]|uniref:protein FAM136A-like n=1 Tax=Ipomoea triloba TaxID=35885 RepID=UPI00125E99E4|nr:protein FAM136A-like [Ipomoea triloba]XP_031124049.1 protein FAM136A-like [Ipomoea triloba]